MLPDTRRQNTTGDGEIIDVEAGPRLWSGSLNIRPHYHGDADAIAAQLELLTGAGASFFVSQATRKGPQSDPFGAVLGGFAPQISAISSDSKSLSISGLPVGYQLTQGDLLSFLYGSNPTRYAMHRIYSTKAADGNGVIDDLQVVPPIRAGAAVGSGVTLVDPKCKAKIVPQGATGPMQKPAISDGISLAWRQVLR